MDHADVLIVGAGHAGAQAAISLRQLGFAGTITLLTEEPDPPYERPPLSKDFLAGEKDFAGIMLRPADFWATKNITLQQSQRVIAVDATAHSVTTQSGTQTTYGQLIWATGGHARRLTAPGHDLAGIHTVRTRADADRMRAELPNAQSAVIIGGGYIGLEAAAVLSKFGKSVTVVEMQNRVLARVAGEPLSRFYEAEHRAHGVTLLLEHGIDQILGHSGRVTGVQLTNGTILPAQMVIVGIGIIPATQALTAAGAAGTNGVDVDEYCRTTLPDIFAIGDCAAHINRFAAGARIRLESVQNAADQAGIVAKYITGNPAPYDAIPWFWSVQYDLRLQTIGLSTGYDQTITRGDPTTRSFSIIYLRQGQVIALDCVNAARDYVQGKALIVNPAPIDPARLADPTVPLKQLAVRPV